MKKQYRSFEDAKEYVISLNLTHNKEWRKYCSSGNKPNDIPSNPDKSYQNKGWISWGDWLGTGITATHKINHKPFSEAKKFVHSLELKSQSDWAQFCRSGKKPKDIPQSPYKVYKKEWISWGDWLGTGYVASQKRKYRIFEEARKFANKQKFVSKNNWAKFAKSNKRPDDIPSSPDRVYKNKGWKGWGDWLGTGNTSPKDRIFRSFYSARNFARSLGIKTSKDWMSFCKSGKKPSDIPANPNTTFKNKGWISWGDWLGTGNIAPRLRKYRTFEEARKFVHTLGLTGANEWREFAKSNKKPNDIPQSPNRTYKERGWISWGDWAGTGIIATYKIKYREFNDAKKFSHSLGLKSANEWREFAKSGKLPKDIPVNPWKTYSKKRNK